MRKAGIVRVVVYESIASAVEAIQPALHRAHPKAAGRLHIHGIDKVGRERTGGRSMIKVVEKQPAGSQFHDASIFCSHPQLVVEGENAVHKVAT